MLYWLTQHFASHFHSLDVFRYLSLRAILAAITSLILSLALGPVMIRKLQQLQLGQVVRDDGPGSHLVKTGTPTMGGVLVISTILLSSLCWSNLSNYYVWIVMLVTLGFSLVGFWDDFEKISRKNSKGVSARRRLLFELIVAGGAAFYLYHTATFPAQTQLVIPFVKHYHLALGAGFVVFAILVMIGSANSVNLTDGLDGLAILPTVLIAAALGIFVYITGNSHFSSYLLVPYIPGVGECVIFCGAMVGAGLGFLWFNAYPAEIFMGDVGSLGLGAALGIIAIVVREELVLLIMGAVFVMETLSVILQVGSFKLRGKRIFKMAPIHHHFELKGWPEPKVIVRFWIITFVFVLIGLATLKIR